MIHAMSMVETLRFAEGFLRNPGKVGAIAPSSPFLAEAMLEGITDITEDRTIIEFGPGTGAVTGQIAHRLPSSRCYMGIELDSRFVTHLRERYPQLHFVHGSAEHAGLHHKAQNMGPVQAIICGLPFASLPGKVQDAVIQEVVTLLPPGGEFRTFQYAHAYAMPSSIRFRRRMSERLGTLVRRRLVFRNLPPAHVLTWRR